MSREILGPITRPAEQDLPGDALVADTVPDLPSTPARRTRLVLALAPGPLPEPTSASRVAAPGSAAQPRPMVVHDLDPDPAPPLAGRTLPAAPARPLRTRRVTVALVLAASAVLGSAVGWRGSALIDGGSAGPQHAPEVTAVAVSSRPSGGGAVLSAVDLEVRVDNLGTDPVTIADADVTWDAAAVAKITPARLVVPAGTTGALLLHATLSCASPQPLRMPPLRMQGPDGRLRRLEVERAPLELAALCQAGVADGRMLQFIAGRVDGDRYAVTVRSPTGRSTEVSTIRAGGVSLTATPLPTNVDGAGRVIWIDRPAVCDPAWVSGGVPRELTFGFDAGGAAQVALDAGFGLTRWLLAGPCAGSTP